MVSIISMDGSDERIILRYPQVPASSIFMYPYLIVGTKVIINLNPIKGGFTDYYYRFTYNMISCTHTNP